MFKQFEDIGSKYCGGEEETKIVKMVRSEYRVASVTSLKMFCALSRRLLSNSSRDVFVLLDCRSNIDRLNVSFHSVNQNQDYDT